MIISTTLASVVLDVLGVVGAGGATGAPLVGTSPARTGTDNNPVSAKANTKRFMFRVSFGIEDAS